jgi:hypothetical protein
VTAKKHSNLVKCQYVVLSVVSHLQYPISSLPLPILCFCPTAGGLPRCCRYAARPHKSLATSAT